MNRSSLPKTAREVWRQFALARGLRYEPPGGARVERQRGWIEGVIDDVPLVFDTCLESSRDRAALHTRVTGSAVSVIEARVSVASRTGIEPPVRAEPVGDAEFDARFYVVGSPTDAARGVLDEPLRAFLLDFTPSLWFTYDGGTARLFWEGEERDPNTLGKAADVVVAACRFRRAAGYR